VVGRLAVRALRYRLSHAFRQLRAGGLFMAWAARTVAHFEQKPVPFESQETERREWPQSIGPGRASPCASPAEASVDRGASAATGSWCAEGCAAGGRVDLERGSMA